MRDGRAGEVERERRLRVILVHRHHRLAGRGRRPRDTGAKEASIHRSDLFNRGRGMLPNELLRDAQDERDVLHRTGCRLLERAPNGVLHLLLNRCRGLAANHALDGLPNRLLEWLSGRGGACLRSCRAFEAARLGPQSSRDRRRNTKTPAVMQAESTQK